MEPVYILLVEDNEGDALLTRVALEETGIPFFMNEIDDGKKAIDFLSNECIRDAIHIDLVLLDINLPKQNGHEVLKHIKSNERLRHIPVVMLTTSSSQKDIDLAYQNNANGFITKPSEMTEFLKAVADIVHYRFPKLKD